MMSKNFLDFFRYYQVPPSGKGNGNGTSAPTPQETQVGTSLPEQHPSQAPAPTSAEPQTTIFTNAPKPAAPDQSVKPPVSGSAVGRPAPATAESVLAQLQRLKEQVTQLIQKGEGRIKFGDEVFVVNPKAGEGNISPIANLERKLGTYANGLKNGGYTPTQLQAFQKTFGQAIASADAALSPKMVTQVIPASQIPKLPEGAPAPRPAAPAPQPAPVVPPQGATMIIPLYQKPEYILKLLQSLVAKADASTPELQAFTARLGKLEKVVVATQAHPELALGKTPVDELFVLVKGPLGQTLAQGAVQPSQLAQLDTALKGVNFDKVLDGAVSFVDKDQVGRAQAELDTKAAKERADAEAKIKAEQAKQDKIRDTEARLKTKAEEKLGKAIEKQKQAAEAQVRAEQAVKDAEQAAKDAEQAAKDADGVVKEKEALEARAKVKLNPEKAKANAAEAIKTATAEETAAAAKVGEAEGKLATAQAEATKANALKGKKNQGAKDAANEAVKNAEQELAQARAAKDAASAKVTQARTEAEHINKIAAQAERVSPEARAKAIKDAEDATAAARREAEGKLVKARQLRQRATQQAELSKSFVSREQATISEGQAAEKAARAEIAAVLRGQANRVNLIEFEKRLRAFVGKGADFNTGWVETQNTLKQVEKLNAAVVQNPALASSPEVQAVLDSTKKLGDALPKTPEACAAVGSIDSNNPDFLKGRLLKSNTFNAAAQKSGLSSSLEKGLAKLEATPPPVAVQVKGTPRRVEKDPLGALEKAEAAAAPKPAPKPPVAEAPPASLKAPSAAARPLQAQAPAAPVQRPAVAPQPAPAPKVQVPPVAPLTRGQIGMAGVGGALGLYGAYESGKVLTNDHATQGQKTAAWFGLGSGITAVGTSIATFVGKLRPYATGLARTSLVTGMASAILGTAADVSARSIEPQYVLMDAMIAYGTNTLDDAGLKKAVDSFTVRDEQGQFAYLGAVNLMIGTMVQRHPELLNPQLPLWKSEGGRTLLQALQGNEEKSRLKGTTIQRFILAVLAGDQAKIKQIAPQVTADDVADYKKVSERFQKNPEGLRAFWYTIEQNLRTATISGTAAPVVVPPPVRQGTDAQQQAKAYEDTAKSAETIEDQVKNYRLAANAYAKAGDFQAQIKNLSLAGVKNNNKEEARKDLEQVVELVGKWLDEGKANVNSRPLLKNYMVALQQLAFFNRKEPSMVSYYKQLANSESVKAALSKLSPGDKVAVIEARDKIGTGQ